MEMFSPLRASLRPCGRPCCPGSLFGPPIALKVRTWAFVSSVGCAAQVVAVVDIAAGCSVCSAFDGVIAPPGVVPPVERPTSSRCAALDVPAPPTFRSTRRTRRAAALMIVSASCPATGVKLSRRMTYLCPMSFLHQIDFDADVGIGSVVRVRGVDPETIALNRLHQGRQVAQRALQERPVRIGAAPLLGVEHHLAVHDLLPTFR